MAGVRPIAARARSLLLLGVEDDEIALRHEALILIRAVNDHHERHTQRRRPRAGFARRPLLPDDEVGPPVANLSDIVRLRGRPHVLAARSQVADDGAEREPAYAEVIEIVRAAKDSHRSRTQLQNVPPEI